MSLYKTGFFIVNSGKFTRLPPKQLGTYASYRANKLIHNQITTGELYEQQNV